MKFQIFYDRKKQFRWRLISRKNNKVIAVAGESFTRKANCKKSINNLASPSLIAALTEGIEDKTIKPKKK